MAHYTFRTLLLLLCPTIVNADCWNLVWVDEFDGSIVDPCNWSFRHGNDWGQLHYNTDRPENAKVSNGKLQLIARRESYMGFDYTAARLDSQHKGQWRYGRIEARMKLPGTTGFVPAFWMLPTERRYGWWPQSGEIDIMEHPTHEPWQIYGTVHTGAYNLFEGQRGPQGSTFYVSNAESAFHIYAIEWTDEKIDFYVDDAKYYTFSNQHTGYTTWPFDQAFFFRLAQQVGGGWVGPPDESSHFPAVMEVDYVRVYQHLENIAILGSDYVLPHSQNVLYSVPDISGADYAWNVSGGAAIVSGQFTRQISIDWEDMSGIVDVVVTTDCNSQTVTYPVEVSPNFLANPGFEKGAKYWEKRFGDSAAAEYSLTTTEFHEGEYSLCVNVKTLGDYPWDIQIAQEDLLLEANKPYEGSFWAKAEGNECKVNAAIINVNDFTLYYLNTFTLTDNWQQVRFEFTASANATAAFNIDLGLQTGTYYLDDFLFTTPSPSSPTHHLHNGDFSLGEAG